MNKTLLTLGALALALGCNAENRVSPSAATVAAPRTTELAAPAPPPAAAPVHPEAPESGETVTAPPVQPSPAAIRTIPPPVAPEPHVPSFPLIEVGELAGSIDSGEVVVVDVRSESQWKAGHVRGAIHIPFQDVFSRSVELPQDKLIVLYCSCPAEESSGAAAMELRNMGFERVAALRGGFDAWAAAGHPVAAE